MLHSQVGSCSDCWLSSFLSPSLFSFRNCSFFTLKSHGKLLLKFDGQLKSSAFFVAAEHLL